MRVRGSRARLPMFGAGALLCLLAACSSSSSTPSGGTGGGTGQGTGGASAGTGGATSGTGGATTGTGGATSGTGGATSGTGGGASGGAGVGARGGSGSGGVNGTGGGAAGGQTGSLALSLDPIEATWSFRKDAPSPATSSPTHAFQIHNGGAASAAVTLTVAGANPAVFVLMSPPTFPATVATGADLTVTVQFRPDLDPRASPAPNNGGLTSSATLTATVAGAAITARANLYGVSLTTVRGEPTLGQVLQTIGYAVNPGTALVTFLAPPTNPLAPPPTPNTMSDEVLVSRFVKANAAAPVGLRVVARFSPAGNMPFGFYTTTTKPPAPPPNMVATMSSVAGSDPNTSDHSELIDPPLVAGSMTTFDPGSASFGLWAYTDQVTSGAGPANGDYLFTEDAFNVGTPHRTRVYPLKDRAGTLVANSFLIGCEEATNGDYQDYLFVLSNAAPAP